MALITPLLIALLVGIVTGAIAFGRKNSMVNASREGARLGATLVTDASWATSVQNRVVDVSGGDLVAAQICVELVYKATDVDTSGSTVQSSSCTLPAGAEPELPSGTALGECVAKVWSRRSTTLETGFFSRDITLDASAVARYERGSGSLCD